MTAGVKEREGSISDPPRGEEDDNVELRCNDRVWFTSAEAGGLLPGRADGATGRPGPVPAGRGKNLVPAGRTGCPIGGRAKAARA